MPHSILKRASRGAQPHSASVRFAPSPLIWPAPSYDRTPIQVSTNDCALPAYGCPGRTYYVGRKSRKSVPAEATARGQCLHPRALAALAAQQEEDSDEADDIDPERTPTSTKPHIPLPVPPPIPEPLTQFYLLSPSQSSPRASAYHQPTFPSNAPPPLVPDLSSESDESDGFVSPPPEPLLGFGAIGGNGNSNKFPFFGYPGPLAYQYLSAFAQNSVVSSDRKTRSRRTTSPRRPVDDADAGYEEEDLPASESHASAFSAARQASRSPSRERAQTKKAVKDDKKPRKERKDGSRVSSLCRSLQGVSFRDADSDGCLGGF